MIPAMLTTLSMLGAAYAASVQPVLATGGCASINSYSPQTGSAENFFLAATGCVNVTAPDQACPIEGFAQTSVVLQAAGVTGISEGYIAIGSSPKAKDPMFCNDAASSLLQGLVQMGENAYTPEPLSIASTPEAALLMWGAPADAIIPVEFYHHYVDGVQQDGLFIGANNVTTWAISEHADPDATLSYWSPRLLVPGSQNPVTGAPLEADELVTYIKVAYF
ncbi:hypothetical protein BO70DRAFT_160640 [Aspergillus heteromorphus CBS 117.55]|uniref:Uncharacterized protein n=1 Tax=Aspergillus heteromorphus CBS 117.55 TaxID=1448321 RepID=A0A317WRI7_9EURO|nr:uncharacterized protein BO70DRAFT_160640 [Aspergillus heteromorphus CBS 117.55]PWY89066.1 hypothetical protein BO70DRAFT_160640 [Aspergillus heteromorphus CBS 117.55]